ncbi:IS701 family transposase [Streptomyces fulvoviolaceus]
MMRTATVPPPHVPRGTSLPRGEVCGTVTDLYAELFGSFRRGDQRRKAEQYVWGLMSAGGRKSMRHIAAAVGSTAAEQRLHHFISKSTWDWRPVRQALARHLERTNPPQAWVVRSLAIPKTGRHTVGVDRHFIRELGRMMNVQQTYGVWLASEHSSAPVNWHLVLPAVWTEDGDRRREGEIPDGAAAETPEQAAITAAARLLDWRLAPRPVVVDARGVAIRRIAPGLAAAGLPVLARIPPAVRLTATGRTAGVLGREPRAAQQILQAAGNLRRPVEWTDPATGVPRVSLAAQVPVANAWLPGPPLTLLGVWDDFGRALPQVWLGSMSAPPDVLLRLTKLAGRVRHDADTAGDLVGLRDFAGRTYHGWHRHMTLASVAYRARLLDDLG